MSKAKSKKTAEDGFDLAGQIKASKVVLHRTDQLIPYARNARKHEPWQVAQIAASIKEFGFTNPVLIDETGEIVAGHGRVMAALKLDLPEVPCIVLGHLTPTQRKAYVLADNQLALNSSWDDDFLKIELEELKLEGFDVELLGFDGLAVDGIPGGGEESRAGNLSSKFLIPPFSVLNAREGWWQERKRIWAALGIKSELGRGGGGGGRKGAQKANPRGGVWGGRRGWGGGGGGAGSSELQKPSTLGCIPPNQKQIMGRTGKYA